MACMCLIALFPFYMMVMMGTYKSNELYKGLKLLPGNNLIENIKSLTKIRFPLYYFNSLFVAGAVALLTVFVCAMAGYGISKYHFKGKQVITSIIMMTMMIPTQLSLVGFAKEMVILHWNNTLLPLIIPPVANAFGVFWMINYTKGSIPDAVIESAKLDGCGELDVFFRIGTAVYETGMCDAWFNCVSVLLEFFFDPVDCYFQRITLYTATWN